MTPRRDSADVHCFRGFTPCHAGLPPLPVQDEERTLSGRCCWYVEVPVLLLCREVRVCLSACRVFVHSSSNDGVRQCCVAIMLIM